MKQVWVPKSYVQGGDIDNRDLVPVIPLAEYQAAMVEKDHGYARQFQEMIERMKCDYNLRIGRLEDDKLNLVGELIVARKQVESLQEELRHWTHESFKRREADLEEALAFYKKMYRIRGKALQRPCRNCGEQPVVIKVMKAADNE